MGTDCAPLVADLFLFFEFMKSLIWTDLSVTAKFKILADDLLTLNNPIFKHTQAKFPPQN